jgi:DNA sulfur modification protein DndE
LARASAHPLPAIIDTPMARLDAAHRRHLVERYFPHASHQVLILSTDTEVDRHYYQALQPHIARAYHRLADSNVEMTWQVFGGDAHEIYLALLKERCERDGLGTSEDVLARQLRLHLHRGIGYLAAPQTIRSISDLIRLTREACGGNL